MYTSIDNIKNKIEPLGYKVNDPWDVVDAFEKMVAEYAGSKYAVAVDNCTNAIFLCLKYLNPKQKIIDLPARTYVSVPQIVIHAGYQPHFVDYEWDGMYQLGSTPIIDSATQFKKGMYLPKYYMCLSFHLKKILNIGKGGMILTDDENAYKWFKKARYEGRDITVKYDDDNIDMLGWNMYMPPEQAAYGIELFLKLPEENANCGGSKKYPDVRNFKCFSEHK